LPFAQPEETYSTSPHLYRDLGIEPAAQGRVVPAGAQTSEPAKPVSAGERTPKVRTRRRLRNGVPVEQNAARASRDHRRAASQEPTR